MQEEALSLASSVLFGSTMGLFDDVVNLQWRYKAVLPVFAALPFMVLTPSGRTTISLPFIGVLELGNWFIILLVPIIVTVVTNTYNQLGGLNGLESLTGLVILIGLSAASGNVTLIIVPALSLLILVYLSYTGKAFIGNVGTFSIGLTLAVYAVLMNLKFFLLVSMIPHLVNSFLTLYSIFILQDNAQTFIDESNHLYSTKIRSLRTLILTHKRLKEHQVVVIITVIIAFFTLFAYCITTVF